MNSNYSQGTPSEEYYDDEDYDDEDYEPDEDGSPDYELAAPGHTDNIPEHPGGVPAGGMSPGVMRPKDGS